jgi:hypothetical protein
MLGDHILGTFTRRIRHEATLFWARAFKLGPADEHMTEPACGVFSDLAGKLIAIAFTLFAFLTYVVSFAIRRGRTDFRSWRVFWLDLSKMGLGQVTPGLCRDAAPRRIPAIAIAGV